MADFEYRIDEETATYNLHAPIKLLKNDQVGPLSDFFTILIGPSEVANGRYLAPTSPTMKALCEAVTSAVPGKHLAAMASPEAF